MNTTDDTRRPDQIEDDIARTRAEVSSTIDAIQERLTPGQMMDQAIHYLRDSGARDFGVNLGRQVRDNPLPIALIGLGVAWLAGSLQGSTRMGVDRVRARTMRMIDEQPLVLGAIGVAIGAAFGAALPATRREDAMPGDLAGRAGTTGLSGTGPDGGATAPR